MKPIPDAPSFPVLGIIPHLARQNMLDYMLDISQQFPDVVRLKIGFLTMYAVSSPQLGEEVMKRTREFRRGAMSQRSQFFLGNGLITADGDNWLEHRRMMQPKFHQRQVVYLTDIIRNTTYEILETRWQQALANNKTLDLWSEVGHIVQKNTMRMLFGADIDDDEVDKITYHNRIVFENFLKMAFLTFIPQQFVPGYKKTMDSVAAIDRIVMARIDEARQTNSDAPTLLNMLIQAKDDETHATLSDQQIRDEIITLYTAGHETTSFVVTMTLVLLAKHPQYLEGLLAEYDAILGDDDPTTETVMRLTKTIAVIKESIRLYAPVPFLPRETDADTELGDYVIPAGTNALVLFYAMHYNANVWEDPFEFKPERFERELTLDQKKYFFGFNVGPHRCIGEHLALVEASTMIAMILRRYSVEIPNLAEVKAKVAATIAFDVAPQVRLTPRLVPVH